MFSDQNTELMEIQNLIDIDKEFYTSILDFIEAEDDSNSEFQNFIDIFEKQDIMANQNELINLIFYHKLHIIITELQTFLTNFTKFLIFS